MIEFDPAPGVEVECRLGRVFALLHRVEQLEDPLGRCNTGLQHVGHRGQLGQRLGELA